MPASSRRHEQGVSQRSTKTDQNLNIIVKNNNNDKKGHQHQEENIFPTCFRNGIKMRGSTTVTKHA